MEEIMNVLDRAIRAVNPEKALRRDYPELFNRAITIEDNAQNQLIKVKGLGRSFAWTTYFPIWPK